MRKKLSMLVGVMTLPTLILAIAGWLMTNGNTRIIILALAAGALIISVFLAFTMINDALGSIVKLRKNAAKALSVHPEAMKADELSILFEIVNKASFERERLLSDLSIVDDVVEQYHVMYNEVINWLTDLSKGYINEKPAFDSEKWNDLSHAVEAAGKFVSHLYGEIKNESLKQEDAVKAINAAAEALDAISAGDFTVFINTPVDNGEVYRTLQESVYRVKDTIEQLVNDISDAMNHLALKDLDYKIKGEYSGDFEVIKKSYNDITDGFNSFITDLYLTADRISSDSNQIMKRSGAFSREAGAQAADVQELTETVKLMSEKTRDNMENAKRAEDLSLASKENADRGNTEMRDMMSAMEGIKDASGNISSIIKVIDDIAFQTNLLALNAAVEAARAGEHGKGFSVVAEEVRNLAAKSMDAARQTSQLLEDTVNRVNQGMSIAERTAESLNQIVEAVTEVTAIIARISKSSDEESEYFTQISNGFGTILNESQNSVGMTNANEADANELFGQSETLRNLCAAYKIRNAVSKPKSAASDKAVQIPAPALSKNTAPIAPKPVKRANTPIDFTSAKAKATLSPESKKNAKAALNQVIKLSAVQQKRSKTKDIPVSSADSEPIIISSTDFGKY